MKSNNKTMVIGAVNENELRFSVRENPETKYIVAGVRKLCAPYSTLVTDALRAYTTLRLDHAHIVVNHAMDEYVNEQGFHTNTIEGAFSHFKRMIWGTHIAVSKKYMQNYANECAFRYTNRKAPNMFISLLSRI